MGKGLRTSAQRPMRCLRQLGRDERKVSSSSSTRSSSKFQYECCFWTLSLLPMSAVYDASVLSQSTVSGFRGLATNLPCLHYLGFSRFVDHV